MAIAAKIQIGYNTSMEFESRAKPKKVAIYLQQGSTFVEVSSDIQTLRGLHDALGEFLERQGA